MLPSAAEATAAERLLRDDTEAELPRLVEALAAPDEMLAQHQATTWPTAWRVGDHGPVLTAGIIFANLIDGVAALNEIARRHGAEIQVRLHEAASEEHDPLSHMRPSSPPPVVPRFDLVVTGAGDNRSRFVTIVSEALGLHEWDLRQQLLKLPCTLARGLSEPRAEGEDRRNFLSAALGTAMGLGFTALAATGGLWTLGTARFMFPNILTEPPSKFKVGFPDAFPPGAVEREPAALA